MRTVIFHNGYNFDTIVMQRHGITLAPEQEEDTMIASHAFASHLPKRLDHVVSVYLDSAPWKITHGRRGQEEKGQLPVKMAPEELCLYNSADARLSILAWKEMQPDLEDERKIYEHDKELSVICRQMQIDGIAFDVARRKEIGREMAVLAADLKGKMRRLLHAPDFTPSRHGDVRWALFDKLGAPTYKATATGLASTSSATLESLRGETRAGRLAELILRYRKVTKIKSTYLDAIDSRLLPHGKRRSDLGKSDGTALGSRHVRAHYNWRPYGTVSGRWSCRFQSVPKWKPTIEDRPREVYVAAPGCELIYFDLSQSEMRAAAFLSGDENFIVTCKGDVHSENAKILFPAAAAKGWLEGGPDCELCKKEIEHTTGCTCPKGNPYMGKPFRDIAKNAGFGILYSAEIDTIYQFLFEKSFTVSVNQVRAMFDLVHRTYARYYEYCAENLAFCQEFGFQRTALLKRIRWIGYYPKPGDVYNFKVQSFIADLMNIRMIELGRRLPKRVRFVAQIHDALIIEAPIGARSHQTQSLIKELWAEEIYIPESDRRMVMPAPIKVAERVSDFR